MESDLRQQEEPVSPCRSFTPRAGGKDTFLSHTTAGRTDDKPAVEPTPEPVEPTPEPVEPTPEPAQPEPTDSPESLLGGFFEAMQKNDKAAVTALMMTEAECAAVIPSQGKKWYGI